MSKCPGQNTQYWGFDAIHDVPCPKCSNPVEFFRDEVRRKCKTCGEMVFNDRMDLGCAKWCPSASSCIGAANFQALQLSEQRKSRREDFRLLLEMAPAEEEDARELFKKLFSEYFGEDRLFDTNRLYTVKEENPALFQSATTVFQAFLKQKAEIEKREAGAAARTRELIETGRAKKSVVDPED
jgi:hypothetical protein